MVDKVCVVCGDKLTGSQRVLCGKSTCRYVYNKPYYLKYQKTKYHKNKIQKYCIVCGKKLKGRQSKYCSTHRYTKKYQKYHNIYEIQNQSTKPLPKPPQDNKCEECNGQIVFRDGEYSCSVCGLVIE